MTGAATSTAEIHRMLAAHACAATIYARHLRDPRASSQRSYLAGRGLGRIWESDKWSVGYARPSWTDLTGRLRQAGFSDTELVVSGLSLRCHGGGLVDRFRDRIMIGIRNPDQHIVAFVGRAAPRAGEAAPKYLNSPTTPIYRKSERLLGLAEHTDALRNGAAPLLVEGPFDVLAIDLHTAAPAVSSCGTAVTVAHASSLRASASADRLIVAFDGDEAGLNAGALAYAALSTRFPEVVTIDVPIATDPAELLTRAGALARWQELVDRAHPLADTVVDRAIEPWSARLDNVDIQVGALRSATRAIVSLLPVDVARQVARVAEKLAFPPDVVTNELAAAAARSASRRLPSCTHSGAPSCRASVHQDRPSMPQLGTG